MIDLVLCTSPQEVIVNFTSQDACTCTVDMMAADGNMLFEISLAQRQGLRSNLAYFFNQPIPHQRFAQAIHVFSGGREMPLRLAHARHLCFELQASGRDSQALHPTQREESPGFLQEPTKLPLPDSLAMGEAEPSGSGPEGPLDVLIHL
ncbi:unnamed protein product [Symbiodinium sp. KB8]|nr:unnamed protein product [Symbiodinium sp. KB8]